MLPTCNQLGNLERKKQRQKSHVLWLFGGPQRRATVNKLTVFNPRKPNSSKRKVAKITVILKRKTIFAKIPGIHGSTGYPLNVYNTVMFEGGSPKDTPGVNYTLIRGLDDFNVIEFFGRKRRRSKFGVKK